MATAYAAGNSGECGGSAASWIATSGAAWTYAWSTRLPGTDDVARVKEGDGGDLVLLGSGELARSLARAGLVDSYVLLVHPIVLGSGTRLFEPGLTPSALELTGTRTSSTGVIIASYRASPRAGGDR